MAHVYGCDRSGIDGTVTINGVEFPVEDVSITVQHGLEDTRNVDGMRVQSGVMFTEYEIMGHEFFADLHICGRCGITLRDLRNDMHRCSDTRRVLPRDIEEAARLSGWYRHIPGSTIGYREYGYSNNTNEPENLPQNGDAFPVKEPEPEPAAETPIVKAGGRRRIKVRRSESNEKR